MTAPSKVPQRGRESYPNRTMLRECLFNGPHDGPLAVCTDRGLFACVGHIRRFNPMCIGEWIYADLYRAVPEAA